MKKHIIWLIVIFLILPSLVIVSCTPAEVEEEELPSAEEIRRIHFTSRRYHSRHTG